MQKKIALLFCLLSLGSAAVLFPSGENEEKALEKPGRVSVVIQHCTSWAYKSTAARLAEEIKKELDIDVELKSGKLHSFDVIVDGNLVFSKFEEDRFPEPEEIIASIRTYLSQ